MRANRGLSDPIGQQVRWVRVWERGGGGEGGIYIISTHIRLGSELGTGKRRGGVCEIYLISSQFRCRGGYQSGDQRQADGTLSLESLLST